jgi:hypothetical protein
MAKKRLHLVVDPLQIFGRTLSASNNWLIGYYTTTKFGAVQAPDCLPNAWKQLHQVMALEVIYLTIDRSVSIKKNHGLAVIQTGLCDLSRMEIATNLVKPGWGSNVLNVLWTVVSAKHCTGR